MNVDALHTYFMEVANRPMQFGHYDCVRFVFESLKVGWGIDYLAEEDMQYCDRRSAVAVLRKNHGLRDAVTNLVGPECSSADLDVGDIAWVDLLPDYPWIGLIMPGYVAVKGNHTIHRVKSDLIVSGWKVT